jgi:hypothetical protein
MTELGAMADEKLDRLPCIRGPILRSQNICIKGEALTGQRVPDAKS